MKKLAFAICAAALLLSSCNLDIDSIMPAAQAITDPGFGGKVEFAVWASGPWSASINADKEYTITITPSSGMEGETLVTVTLPENLTYEERVGYIEFTCGKCVYSTGVYQATPNMYIDDENYFYAVKMKDGKWWNCQNVSYLSDGNSLTDVNFKNNTGIWYPCLTTVSDGGAVTVKASTNLSDAWKQGYFYSNEKKNVCAEGWHLPSVEEWQNLMSFYQDSSMGGASVKAMNDDKFYLYPYQYVEDGSHYTETVLNFKEGSDFKNMAERGFLACSDEYNADEMMVAGILNTDEATILGIEHCSKTNGINVRCVRDVEQK